MTYVRELKDWETIVLNNQSRRYNKTPEIFIFHDETNRCIQFRLDRFDNTRT
jgi:hypothetical protein